MIDRFFGSVNLIFYSIGYEGLTIAQFIEKLHVHGVKRIVDVRRNPWSNKPEFCKDALQQVLANHHIEYLGSPQCSPPLAMWYDYKSNKDYDRFAQEFDSYLAENSVEIQEWATTLQDDDCILCYEKNDLKCHRSRLYAYIPYKVIPIK